MKVRLTNFNSPFAQLGHLEDSPNTLSSPAQSGQIA